MGWSGGDEFALWRGHAFFGHQQTSLLERAAMAHATAGFQWMDIQFGKMHDIFLRGSCLMRVWSGGLAA